MPEDSEACIFMRHAGERGAWEGVCVEGGGYRIYLSSIELMTTQPLHMLQDRRDSAFRSGDHSLRTSNGYVSPTGL